MRFDDKAVNPANERKGFMKMRLDGSIANPPVDEATTYISAGAVTFGVEYRCVDADIDEQATKLLGQETRAEILALLGITGDGQGELISIHVLSRDGTEYLRFDSDTEGPHYHYILPTENAYTIESYDDVANGDFLEWTFERLRCHLPQMLRACGADSLADSLDFSLLGPALEEAEEAVRDLAPS